MATTMDIEQFYDADPRRRGSEELQLGNRWTDTQGTTYLLSWVEETGELYLMRDMTEWAGSPTGRGPFRQHLQALPDTVMILSEIHERHELNSVLAGWEQAMQNPESVTWLCSRPSDRGLLSNDPRADLSTVEPIPGRPEAPSGHGVPQLLKRFEGRE
jgi:hypothetical protein